MLFGFALRRNMKDSWFEPFHFSDAGAGRPAWVTGIPDERIQNPDGITYDFAYQRGGMGVGYTQPGGNVWLMQAERPMKSIGPSILFIQVHTTGVKSRSLSHENEKACWSLIVNNQFWCSARSNNAVRKCYDGSDAGDPLPGDIAQFYPKGLDYRGVQQWGPNPTGFGTDTNTFSWLHPNWAYTTVPRASI
jgi:hypothetical protein